MVSALALALVVKGWIMLSTALISIWWKTQYVLSTPIHWIVIYALDSIISPLNKWALDFKS